jgi:hypothetical protein
VPLDRVRLTAAKSGLERHRKLRLARPRARTRAQPRKTMNSASPDPRAQTRAQPRKTTNSASPDPGLGLGLSPGRRRTPPRLTQGSDSGSAPEDDELRLARPRAWTRAQPRKTTNSASPDPGLRLRLSPGRRRTPPRPTPGLGHSPSLSRRSPPRPTQGLGLDLGLGRQTRPRPRRSLHLAQPRARTDHITGGAIITLPQADSGYGEQDRRPIWLAPVNK